MKVVYYNQVYDYLWFMDREEKEELLVDTLYKVEINYIPINIGLNDKIYLDSIFIGVL